MFFVLNLPPFTDLCKGNDKSLCFCFFIGQTKPLQLYLLLSQFWADLSFHDFLCLPERVQFIKSWLLTEHTVSPDSWDYKWQTTSQFHYKWAQGEEGLLRGWRVARKGGLSVPFQICTFAKGSQLRPLPSSARTAAHKVGLCAQPVRALNAHSTFPSASCRPGSGSACLLSCISSLTSGHRRVPFVCFHKILCTGPV